jgi:hypothetical protein
MCYLMYAAVYTSPFHSVSRTTVMPLLGPLTLSRLCIYFYMKPLYMYMNNVGFFK